MDLIWALTVPLAGTILGSACVFVVRGQIPRLFQRGLDGFASGIMIAAAVWSLLIPALEQGAENSSQNSTFFLPVVFGFIGGTLFLLILDHLIPHLHRGAKEAEGLDVPFKRSTKLALAVTLHNIPEGMAVGVVFSALLASSGGITKEAAIALAIGIAIQNFPEGAIISLPLRADGMGRFKAFAIGAFSGVVEPIAVVITVLATSLILPILPFLLAFAAGAMVYVVIEELVPDMADGEHSDIGPILFAIGFALMMALDVALG
ncbi:MAG: ZIP family metal transporter [Actinomycetaceae bacterium]|nr:ZIP family metal transporter [Actinomycetaceae bacterium]